MKEATMTASRLLTLVGVFALLAAVVLALGRAVVEPGSISDADEAVAAVSPPATPAPPASSASPSASASSRPSPPAIATRSARLADQPPVEEARPPRAVAIPARGIRADVVSVGVEPDGQMTVPSDVATAGWYRFGPVPGEVGSAVVAGHVDSRSQGRGAFFDLVRVRVGDEVVVTDADGVERTWVVTAREVVDKDVLPVGELYRRDGPPRLVLITCGGDFDGSARSYESNVIVVAEPA
jgi:hypothetical protein